MDNIDAGLTDAFDCTISRMKFALSKNADMKDKTDELKKSLTMNKIYLKVEYKPSCAANKASEVPDHPRPFASSDP